MKSYRILAFDGGGVRGALTVNLVARLIKHHPSLITKTDLLAGTSTGSFIALGLADSQPITKLVNLYKLKNIKSVFDPDYINLVRPKYDRCSLKTLLQTVFSPQITLNKLDKQIVVPAFRVVGPKNWTTVFFNNYSGSTTKQTKVITAALASSAAPTYFSAYQQYIDGGVTANNPSLAALSLAKNKLDLSLTDICLLSIGTGQKPNQINNPYNWGIMQWAFNPTPPPKYPLLNIITEGGKKTVAKLSHQLLGSSFYRLNPPLPCSISLDDYEQVPKLVNLASNYNLQPVLEWLNKNW